MPQPPQATPPDPGTIISATSPSAGVLTTSLLDPAVPPAGAAQVLRELKGLGTLTGAAHYHFVLSRFLTRPLPAQVIGSGTWKLGLAMRQAGTVSSTFTLNVGACLAQWRPGSGVIARAFDNVNIGTGVSTPAATTQFDAALLASIAGSALTLLADDCLILEVWADWDPSATAAPDLALLLGGLGQYAYLSSGYSYQALIDTDAVLVAPAAITFT